MRTELKVKWGDTILLRDGRIAKVVESDDQPPYTVLVFIKNSNGSTERKWIATEQIDRVISSNASA